MKYLVRYDPKAEKQLEKLPAEIARRIVLKMRRVGDTGRGIESMKDEEYGYKVRIGDYRVLVDVTNNPDTIWVRYVDHRHRVYKNL